VKDASRALAYYFVAGKSYEISGCWTRETEQNTFELRGYDVFDVDQKCLNEGSPFFEWPTWEEVRRLVEGRET